MRSEARPHRRMPYSHPIARWLVGALVVMASATASAQVTATAQLSHRTQYVNDPIELRIVVDGTTQASVPDVPAIDGVEVEFVTSAPRSSRSISFVNGRRTEQVTESVTFVYRLVSREPGRFLVPAMTVRSGTSELTTRVMPFETILPDRPDEFTMLATLDRTEVFVGEPVSLQMIWYVGLEVEAASFERNQPVDGLRVLPRQDPTYNAGRRSETLQAFGIFGDATTAEVGRGELDGRRYTTVTIDATLVPERAGEFEIGPLGVDFSFVRPGSRQLLRGETVAGPLRLSVRPMPEEGRPDGFAGLVGRHAISARIDRDRVSVGDPITLRVDVTSDNPFSLLSDGPALADVPAFAGAFRADSDGWEPVPGRSPGNWTFSTTIRANSDTVEAVPALPLWWFDPESGRYTRAQTQPIPLRVRPTTIVTAADAIGGAGGASTTPGSTPGLTLPGATEPEALGGATPGLWALDRDPLRSARPTLGDSTFSNTRSVLGALAVPPALVLAAWLYVAWGRWRDPGASRIARARSRALASIRAARRTSDLGDALVRFAARARGGPESAACAADLEAMLGRAGAVPPPSLRAIAEHPEASRFGAGDPGAPPTPEQRSDAAELVRTLAASLLAEHRSARSGSGLSSETAS